MAGQNEEKPNVLDFADVIRDLGHGSTNRQATEQLRDLVAACATEGKKGSITLTIAINARRDGIVEMASAVKVTKPQPSLPGGAYFTTSAGGLVTEDPRQMSIPKRILGDAPIKIMSFKDKDQA